MDLSERLRLSFLTGVVLVAPLALTVIVARLVYGWLVSLVRPVLSSTATGGVPFAEPLALLALLALVTGLGLVVRQGFGDAAVSRFDEAMETIPGLSAVYTSARQASTALAGGDEQFERVALVRWPDGGLWTVGFVTSETEAPLSAELPGGETEPHYNVFVPMVPNPMGGFLAVVPESDLEMTDIDVSEGIQILVTTGMSGDEEFDVDEFAAT